MQSVYGRSGILVAMSVGIGTLSLFVGCGPGDGDGNGDGGTGFGLCPNQAAQCDVLCQALDAERECLDTCPDDPEFPGVPEPGCAAECNQAKAEITIPILNQGCVCDCDL